MLQTLKLAFSNAPAAPREPEPSSDALAASFAGCLAQASLGPTPAPAQTAPMQPREERPAASEPLASPEGVTKQAPTRTASPRKTAPEESAAETPSPKAEEAALKAEAKAATSAQSEEPSSQAASPSDAAPKKETMAVKAEVVAPIAALPQPAVETAPVAAPTAGSNPIPVAAVSPDPALSATQAQTELSRLIPTKANLHFQFSEGSPESPSSKPALVELLAVPKPEMEVPLPADQAFKAMLSEQSATQITESLSTPQTAQSLPAPQAASPSTNELPVQAQGPKPAPTIQAPLKETLAQQMKVDLAAPAPVRAETNLRAASEARSAARPELPESLPTPVSRPVTPLRFEVPDPPQPRRASSEPSHRNSTREESREAPRPKEPSVSTPSAPERPAPAAQARTTETVKDTTAPVLIQPKAIGPTAPPPTASTTGWVTAPVTATTSRTGLGLPQLPANPALAQVEGGIRWMLKHQEKSAEILLNPESLGRVVIKLRVEGGEVHARMWASEASTVPLLQDQRAALEASLRQQGLSLGSFDLHQGHRGQDASNAQHQPRFDSGANFAQSISEKQDVPTALPVVLDGSRLIEVLV